MYVAACVCGVVLQWGGGGVRVSGRQVDTRKYGAQSTDTQCKYTGVLFLLFYEKTGGARTMTIVGQYGGTECLLVSEVPLRVGR